MNWIQAESIENFLYQIALISKLLIEAVAILIVILSILRTIPKIISSFKRRRGDNLFISLRLNLAVSLALALEFLLAADIVGTAISPSWETIGNLAAIAGIRTFLNYFLQKEVQELEKEIVSNHVKQD